MIPTNLPPGTPLVCIDAHCSTLTKGAIYRLVRYQGDDSVVLLHPDGYVDRGWRYRFNVAKSPDGADYQAADDVDLVNH
jgi:hypothetical protein